MPIIEHEAKIAANPREVFALIGRGETFADDSDAINTIVRLGERRYRWRVRMADTGHPALTRPAEGTARAW